MESSTEMNTTVDYLKTSADSTASPEPDLPLRDRAFATLKQRILEGEILPGTVLSEARVAVDLGISRTPVREALARLTHEGLAQRFNGRGVIVLELSAKELIDVIELQACLEQFAIARLLEGAPRSNVEDVARLVELQREALDAGDRRRFLEHDRRMHLRIVERAGNDKLAQVMRNVSDLLTYAGHRALSDDARMRATLGEHETLLRALDAGNLGDALAASRAHIQGAKRRLLE
jgi:DNA-binding GntR family transcriptional regulator